jgi:choline dehydrogenase-like flavoprotein
MVRFAEKTQVDFVVVGGGGAGAIVANELSTAGLQVVLLEQGPYLHENDFEHDELQFKDIFDPPGIGREVLTRDHTLQPDTFRKTEKEKAVVVPFAEYGRCIGGGTVHFTGNYWRTATVCGVLPSTKYR